MPRPVRLPACSVLLLAGGRGQRVGGADKGLLEWRGRPLIARLHALVRPFTDDLIISCNRNADRYAAYADRLVQDDSPDFPGPLAGIRAGLAAARHDHLLVLPCDAPLIDAVLLEELSRLAAQHPEQAVMVRQAKYWQPLVCMLPKRLSASLEEAWQRGERSPQRVFLPLGVIPLDCAPDDPRLANLNTPELLANAAAMR